MAFRIFDSRYFGDIGVLYDRCAVLCYLVTGCGAEVGWLGS
jgi:hypothetical protein